MQQARIYASFWFYKTITLKYVKIFERLEISETIYEVFVEPSYLKTTRAYDNCAGHSRQMRIEAAL